MKKAYLVLGPLALLAALALSIGCDDDDDGGGKDYDNVKACNDWLAATSCGDFDFTTGVDCSSFEGYACDVSDYFECLTDNTTCDEATGIPDIAGWANCTDKSQCN